MTVMTNAQVSRRALLGGGGALIVSFAIAPRSLAQEAPAAISARPATPLPGSLRTTPMLDS
jgi:nicotinate dehydrogenase subunit B